MRFLLGFTLVFGLVPISAANGAMGLGLERWDLRFWFAYVAAMVLAEAWLIGRALGFSWTESLLRSVCANLVTGFCCGGSGVGAPFMHSTIGGSKLNPNPLLDTFLILVIFAVPSGLFESIAWKGQKVWRIIGIHLALVPVGMAILLIPERPYKGVSAFGLSARNRERGTFIGNLRKFIQTQERLPKGNTLAALRQEVSPETPMIIFYTHDLTRFSTGVDSSRPMEINPSALGVKVQIGETEEGKEDWLWLLKSPKSDSAGIRIEVDLRSGAVRTSPAN